MKPHRMLKQGIWTTWHSGYPALTRDLFVYIFVHHFCILYFSFNLTLAESSTMSIYVGQEWDNKYETRQAITNWLANKGESWRVEKAEKNRYLVKCDHCDFRIRASLSNKTGGCNT